MMERPTAHSEPINTVCIQWPAFGPYHLARLRASHRHFERYGIRIVALETAGSIRSLAWDVVDDPVSFERVRLFPDENFRDLTPTRIDVAMRSALDRIGPDAVVTHSYFLPDSRAAFRWSLKNDTVAVAMVESKEDDVPRTRWRELVKSAIVSHYDAALVGGRSHREYMRKLGMPGDRIFFGYDVVDNGFFQDGALQARKNPERFRDLPGLSERGDFFLASGRFIVRKNLPGLLDAYSDYRKRSSAPWRLIILGDGPLRADLETKIASERIGGVTLAGLRSPVEVCAYYAFAGALVHVPTADQWGLVVNEAMATGLPVIASTGAGCTRELIEHEKNGLRVDSSQIEQIASAMLRLESNDSLRTAMGNESRRIIANWSPDRFAEGLHKAVARGAEAKRAHRPLLPRFLLWSLQIASSDLDSFGKVEE